MNPAGQALLVFQLDAQRYALHLAAVRRVLTEPSYRAAARRLQAENATHDTLGEPVLDLAEASALTLAGTAPSAG